MLHVSKDPDTLLTALANFVVARAKVCIEQSGRFTIALSGGSSPKRLYELLASDGIASALTGKRFISFLEMSGTFRRITQTAISSWLRKRCLFL